MQPPSPCVPRKDHHAEVRGSFGFTIAVISDEALHQPQPDLNVDSVAFSPVFEQPVRRALGVKTQRVSDFVRQRPRHSLGQRDLHLSPPVRIHVGE